MNSATAVFIATSEAFEASEAPLAEPEWLQSFQVHMRDRGFTDAVANRG
jgi:hypothetical protein